MKTSLMILMTTFLVLSNFASAELTPSGFDTGKCTKCHTVGDDTKDSAFPRLEGQTVEYFTSAMNAYKNHKRHTYSAERLMSQRIINLKISSATIDQLAVYFNQLKPKAATNAESPSINAGKEIYANSCAMCHGDKAEGSGTNARLAGQYNSVVKNQLHAYQESKIDNADDMKDIAKTLSASDIEDLASYLETL